LRKCNKNINPSEVHFDEQRRPNNRGLSVKKIRRCRAGCLRYSSPVSFAVLAASPPPSEPSLAYVPHFGHAVTLALCVAISFRKAENVSPHSSHESPNFCSFSGSNCSLPIFMSAPFHFRPNLDLAVAPPHVVLRMQPLVNRLRNCHTH